ncbi:MAG TPA: beta-ketoacyl-[acyl-carrier-protein] synthase family protein [Vicinamibacterales bacterium]|nr:beta-ketoacyl-[acyl-carrier-protein] synthase family protein [Vicinamibacterales bacterium]
MTDPVVVTGVGMVTAAGIGVDAWRNLLAGRCAIGPVRSFDTGRHAAHIGAEISGFESPAGAADAGRATAFAIAAARLAIADAGIAGAEGVSRAGVVVGTTSGEPAFVERLEDSRAAGGPSDAALRDLAVHYPGHVIPARVAHDAGFHGPALTIPTACAAGNYAIAAAVDLLRAGRADVMIAGGADAFSRITFTGFARLGAIAPERCQPFDRHRKGMVPGEGAGMLVLERASRARRRGARIHAEVAGYGLSCDAFHMTGGDPAGSGAVRAMEAALTDARLPRDAVSYISAHGTGTPVNDRLEAIALGRLFGDAARRIPTSSIKSMIGHAMGAASAIEAVVCVLASRDNLIPPTIHYETPDPECRLDCVPNAAREHEVRVAMNNAYGFGGNNASVLFRKWES